MENQNLRTMLKMKNIPLWKIAEAIGVSEPTITRWFRVPLTNEQYEKVLNAIAKIERGGL